MRPELSNYSWIIVNSSAGKDSQAMLDYVVEQADRTGYDRGRIVVLHCDLGLSPGGQEIEWPGTKELAKEHAEHYGLRFEMVRREVRGFLEEIVKRGAWPSSTERYCTSYYKRDQGAKVVTRLVAEAKRGSTRRSWQPLILNCFGFRAEESPRRKKLKPYTLNGRLSSSVRTVHDWLPIHHWTTENVWGRIRQAGTRHHHAYDQGMTRLSCRFCIFAPKSQLMRSAQLNPQLFQEYLEVERKIDHKFRIELSLADVDAAVKAGEAVCGDDGNWNM